VPNPSATAPTRVSALSATGTSRDRVAPCSAYRAQPPISSILRRDLIMANPESELTNVIDLMIEHRVGALPVVAPGSLELVGIISYVDVLRVSRNRL
jgi:CBS domain-containing protein